MKPPVHIPDPSDSAGFYDKCVSSSPNGLVYALSWYMDIVCPEWEVLATEDFSTVMPLPVTRSFGRKIIKQPPLAWQLGVFSTRIPSPEIVEFFLRSLPPGYRLKKLCLNKFNVMASYRTRLLNTAELDLIRPYPLIQSRYGPALKKSLENSDAQSLSYVNNISVNDMLMFAYKLDRFNRRRLNPKEISLLRLIATNAIRFRSGQIGAAYDVHNNLIATVLFLIFKGRASILYASASSEGMACKGIEYIIDRFIEMNAEENIVLGVDNPHDKNLLEMLGNYGSAISNFPCLRHIP